MDEVFKAPRVGKLVVLPGVVDGQQGQVIPLRLVELCLALVRHCLLVLEGGGEGGRGGGEIGSKRLTIVHGFRPESDIFNSSKKEYHAQAYSQEEQNDQILNFIASSILQ